MSDAHSNPPRNGEGDHEVVEGHARVYANVDPRTNLIHAAQQCADAAAQMLLHHMEEGGSAPPSRFEGELIDRLAEALRTAIEVEQDALDFTIAATTRPAIAHSLKVERSALGQLAAACSNFLLREGE